MCLAPRPLRLGGLPHPLLRPLPPAGDVGSFVLKLAQGLQGQAWAADWAEELRQGDRQKEQDFRWDFRAQHGRQGALSRGPVDRRRLVAGRRQCGL